MKFDSKVLFLYGSGSGENDVSFNSISVLKRILDKKLTQESYLLEFDLNNFVESILKIKPDFVVNAMHGKYGEDGLVQSVLDLYGIKYSNCGTESIMSFNKKICKEICKSQINNFSNVKYARDFYLNIRSCFDEKNNLIQEKALEINSLFKGSDFLIFKPNESGSSIGVFKVKNSIANISNAICNIRMKYLDFNYIVEEFISGQESTCCVFKSKKDSNNLESILINIDFVKDNLDIFDYNEKYSSHSSAKHILEDKSLPDSLKKTIKEFSAQVHILFKAKDFSRLDFIIVDNLAYFCEINTHPGFTETSFIPEALRYKYPNGIEDYLCSKLLDI